MRTATPEQKAKAQARREAFKVLWKQVAAMSDDERQAFIERHTLVTCEGRSLSPRNAVLVLMQNPTSTVVGGFRQWLAQGRCVRKGEHGATIWVPTSKKLKDESGEAAGEETRFLTGVVFDIAQTEEAAQDPERWDGQS